MKLSELATTEIESVKLTLDTDGQYRVEFSADELQSINSMLKSEMDATYQDWTSIWNRSVDNTETYRTVKIPIPDGGQSIYPAPIARIPADQIISSVFNAAMRPRPVFSIDAYLDAMYDLPNPPPGMQQPSMLPGTMMPQVPVQQVTSERAARAMEQGYDFVLRERVNIASKLMRGVRGAVIGSPFWWKVVMDPQKHTSLSARSNGTVIDLNDKYEQTHLRGDIVKWYLVPFTNAMMPVEFLYEQDGIDLSPWFAERKHMRPTELSRRYESGDLFLIKDDAEAATLMSTTIDQQNEFSARADVSTKRKVPSTPIQVIPNWFTWFYRDVRYIDPNEPATIDGKQKWKVKRLSLMGDFHLGSGKLMSCWLNNYEHQCRPFELVDQMDDGDCTVDRLRYHQTVFTYGAQAEIKSKHISNHLGFWHDPHVPEVANFFASHKVLNAGDHIPGLKDKEWGTFSGGEARESMLPLLNLILSMSQLDSRENDFTMGGRPPGRTPTGTVNAVFKHAEETKTMFLARLSMKLSRLVRLDAETRRQYQPLGEVLPVWDAEDKAPMEVVFRFPVGDVLDNFRIALTAADEALTEERDPQQIMMRKQALMMDGEYVAKIIAAIVNIQQPLPTSVVTAFTKIIDRDQQLMRKVMGQMVTDEENYDLTPEIAAIVTERNQALQQLQQQQQMQSQQPPQPPPPQVKVSLSGQLTPEQEAAAAQAALGVNGNAQSPSGPQPTTAPPGASAPGSAGPAQPAPQRPGPAVPRPAPPAPPAGTAPQPPVQ